MKAISRVLVILGLLFGSCICAMAGNIQWGLYDVYFDNGNTATGYFITNSAINTVLGYSLVVSGPDLAQDFTATIFVEPYLPGTIGFANSSFSDYVALYLLQNLTGAGGVVPIGSGYDCGGGGGCGTLLVGNGYDPHVYGWVPEPSALLVMGSSLAILGTMLRRKLNRA